MLPNNMKPSLKALSKELDELYEKWDNVLLFGCVDPHNEDGKTLESIRKQIHYIMKKMDEYYPNVVKPMIYHNMPPPAVMESYMARSMEIRNNAKNTLWLLQKNKYYLYLTSNFSKLTFEEQREELRISDAINQVQLLAAAVANDDLLFLRWTVNPNILISYQKAAADKLKRLLAKKNQTTITEIGSLINISVGFGGV